MPNIPVRTLFKNFQVFNVLDDGSTFSGAENSQILVYPNDEYCTEDQLSDLENGMLPETGDLVSIDMSKLLNEAIKAKLPCVAELTKLIGGVK
jgi:hypothetical protein